MQDTVATMITSCAFCFSFDEPIAPDLFDEWLSLLVGFKGQNILRIKGIVNLAGEDKPVVIQACSTFSTRR